MVYEEQDYKGKPVVILKRSADDRFPFAFGLQKAKLIIEHYDEIKKFVEKNDK